MKHETEIFQLLKEGRSYSFIQAKLGVYPAKVATVAMKVFGRRRSSSPKKNKEGLAPFEELTQEQQERVRRAMKWYS